jgi:folylpolyglutamate synthase/dihydrofolate synthase
MNYDEALQYIHSTWKFGSKLGLENVKELLRRLDNPQDKFPSIHVAGTNGKGSVTSMIAHILYYAGYRVGMFISPYLENFTERIQVDLREIPRDDLARITQKVKAIVDDMVKEGLNHPTEFEIVTAIGFTYFAEKKVDIAVVEVGLGGRLDATNVLKPIVSVITSISYDHMDILGDTLGKIAYEKAGIIKEGVPVVSYPQLLEAAQVIRQVAAEKKAPLTEVSPAQIEIKEQGFDKQIFDFTFENEHYWDLKITLPGEHQFINAATALTTIMIAQKSGLSIEREAIYAGLGKTVWPGRLEKLCGQPLIIIDGAHNASGANALARAIKDNFEGKKIILVLGILKDKDVEAIIKSICPLVSTVIVTTPDSSRAMSPEELAKKVKAYCKNVIVESNADKALDIGMQTLGEDEVMLVSGSLYLVGRARGYIRKSLHICK